MTPQEQQQLLHELPQVLRVWPDLGQVLQIGRASAYELVRSNQIRSFRCNRSIRVSRDALLEFINQDDDVAK